MSLVGQVLWKRSVMGSFAGPGEDAGAGAGVVDLSVGAGALRSAGWSSLAQPATTAAAPTAAVFRKPRRVAAVFTLEGVVVFFMCSPMARVRNGGATAWAGPMVPRGTPTMMRFLGVCCRVLRSEPDPDRGRRVRGGAVPQLAGVVQPPCD